MAHHTKAMAVTADFDASIFSINKPKHRQPKKKIIEPKVVEKLERKTATAKEEESSKDHKVKNLSSKDELQQLGNRKKVEGFVGVKDKKAKEILTTSTVKDTNWNDLLNWNDMNKSMSSVSLTGRRRSFCGSQVELADYLASNGAKIVSVDMPPFMLIHAIGFDCARKTYDSLEKFTSKTLALTLKKEFDGIDRPTWHCIVRTSFGFFMTHSVRGFLCFSIYQKLDILRLQYKKQIE